VHFPALGEQGDQNYLGVPRAVGGMGEEGLVEAARLQEEGEG